MHGRRLTKLFTRSVKRNTSHESRVTSHAPAGFTPLEIPKRIRIWDKKQRFLTGLTLTEVVVASALLILAISPILKALTSAHLSTTIIEHKTRSLTLAQAKLDEIKARSIYHYTNEGDPNQFAQDYLPLGNSYLCNIADDANDTLKTITVSVGYDDNGDSTLAADEIKVTLTTLLARRWTD